MMQYAIFARPVVTIYDLPQTTKQSEAGLFSTIGDEGLYGQACQVRTAPGGVTAEGVPLSPEVAEVVTFYGYHGFVRRDALKFVQEDTLRDYLPQPLVLVGRATDVLSLPKVAGGADAGAGAGLACSAACPSRPRRPRPTQARARVALLDGRTGYVRDVALEPVRFEMTAVFSQRRGWPLMTRWPRPGMSPPGSWCRRHCRRGNDGSEEAFRDAVCAQAKKYLGTEYRWGGKSGRGIDCSGLVSSAYMQCGVLIYRDARIVEGWPMHQIPFADKKRGDALYFPGHIALYLGEGRYIHSTGASASGGVVINSLDPADPLYREDLVKSLYAVGSVF